MPSEGNVRAPSQDYFGQAGLCIHNSLPLSTQHNGVNACVYSASHTVHSRIHCKPIFAHAKDIRALMIITG